MFYYIIDISTHNITQHHKQTHEIHFDQAHQLFNENIQITIDHTYEREKNDIDETRATLRVKESIRNTKQKQNVDDAIVEYNECFQQCDSSKIISQSQSEKNKY